MFQLSAVPAAWLARMDELLHKIAVMLGALPQLRALWPGPLVCRWSLNSKHGSYGYEEAKDLYQPFDLAKAVDLAGTAIRSRTDN